MTVTKQNTVWEFFCKGMVERFLVAEDELSRSKGSCEFLVD
jgi:hypothetical protein